MPIANTCSIGYPHDSRADNTAYRHDRRADNAAYRHDRRADSLSRLRHQKSLTSKIIETMGRQTHNKSEPHCNFKLRIMAKQEPNFKFGTAKSSK